MVEHQEHFGRKFYIDKQTGYWISTDHPRIRAHQWIWINHHSVIPKGYHIHHRNENKSDNRIENLELIERSRHISIHSSKPENVKRIKILAEQNRPLTKKWHSSEEGKEWHKQHASNFNFGYAPFKEYICQQCDKSY